MPKLIAVQLETCHANEDGTAWYAYFEGVPKDRWPELNDRALSRAAKKDGASLGIELSEIEEVPNALSKYAGLRRFYVGAAV